ncbi:30S ribosomal protein S8 [Candidatus Berkelbacteria bacterium]|nr:30S ribosomal protein S8 [Candidatus Berkelbacteria bacterium]
MHKLQERGFVKSVGRQKEKGKLYLTAELGAIIDIERLSKPSRRIYVQARKIPLYRAKRSKILLSTPKGLLFDHEARKQNVGGEVVLEIS